MPAVKRETEAPIYRPGLSLLAWMRGFLLPGADDRQILAWQQFDRGCGSLCSGSDFYREASRRPQDQFDTRRIADRLVHVDLLETFSEEHRDIIENALMFFLATADRQGQPDVSYKGGLPGFVRVTGPSELAFPDYNGNGMFKSLGTPHGKPGRRPAVHPLDGSPEKLRILSRASINRRFVAR